MTEKLSTSTLLTAMAVMALPHTTHTQTAQEILSELGAVD